VELRLLPGTVDVHRLPADAPVPAAPPGAALWAALRSIDELTVVTPLPEPAADRTSPGWSVLTVTGPLAHDLVGVLADLSACLAAAGVPIFALSAFATDHLLVPATRAGDAVTALRAEGHQVLVEPAEPPEAAEPD
jgi:hypothetical protein